MNNTLEFTRAPGEKIRTWSGAVRFGKVMGVSLAITLLLMAIFLTN
ncbi:MAG: hypothetical protein K0U36_07095 [Alphaproteobacteria bacterium]|nr:hypothetical protein [Alphaproteobacteria bacterium]